MSGGVELEMEINFDDIIEDVNDLFLKQVPFASKLALSDTVFETTVKIRDVMPRYIQGGPVRYTQSGVRYTKPKSKRELVATVYIPDDRWKYMQWVIDGGDKRWNKSGSGISVPIYENVNFNKYGNIPGKKRKERLWREILKRGKGRTATPVKGALSKTQFIATINGTTGLWKRSGKGGRANIKLLMKFTKEAVPYRKTFPFTKLVEGFARPRFVRLFNKRLVDVIQRELKHLNVN